MSLTIDELTTTLVAGAISTADQVRFGVSFDGDSQKFPFDEMLAYAAGIGLSANDSGLQLDLSSLAEATPVNSTDYLVWTPTGGPPQKVLIDDLLVSPDATFDTIADLRASTARYDAVRVLGHSAVNDGGGGVFQYLGTGATPGDLGTGDDDNGWHIVGTTTTDIYGRHDDTIRPQHFGVIPYDDDAAAASGMDQSVTLQRSIDLWRNPNTLGNGWGFRNSNQPTSLKWEASSGFYRVESTLQIYVDANYTAGKGYFENYTPGNMRWYGKSWVPYATEIPAMEFRAYRNGPKPDVHLNAFKQRNTGNQSCWWTNQNWPAMSRNVSRYRTWAATTEFYRHERITHTHADGSVYLYTIDTPDNGPSSGTTAGSARTHTSGTVTDGTVDLVCIGQVTTSTATGNETWSTKIRKSRDWGIHIRTAWEVKSLTCEADGFTVGVMCCPREDGSAVGWSDFTIPYLHACKHGVMCVEYGVERRVADNAERDAITGQPVGYRVTVYNGGAELNYEWDGATWSGPIGLPSAGWCNYNRFNLGVIAPDAHGAGNVSSVDSTYGIVVDTWEEDAVGPSNNVFTGSSLEHFLVDSTVAECCQVLLASGSANDFYFRDDTPNVHGRVFCAHDNDHLIGLHDTTRYPSSWNHYGADRNRMLVNRLGVIYANNNRSYRTAWNNSRWNIIREAPYDVGESPTSTLDAPVISRTGVFSGTSRFYSTKLTSWYIGSATRLDYLRLSNNYSSSIDLTRYHAESDSFDVVFHYGLSFIVDLPDNFEGLARILVNTITADPSYKATSEATNIQHRMCVRMLDENNVPVEQSGSSVFLDTPTWPLQAVTATGVYVRWQDSNDDDKPTVRALVPKPHVRRLLITMSGPRIQGVTVRVFGDPTARILPAHYDSQLSDDNYVASEPDKGIYTGPTRARLISEPNREYQLLTSDTTTKYHATAGSTSAIVPTGTSPNYWLHDGAAQGSAEIFEWDGSSLQSIATNAYYTEPGDWFLSGGGYESQGNLGATPTVDWSLVHEWSGVLDANVTTLTFTDPTQAGTRIRWALVQDGTGGRTVDWSGVPLSTRGRTPIIDTTPNAVTAIEMMWNGTNYVIETDWDTRVRVAPTNTSADVAAVTNAIAEVAGTGRELVLLAGTFDLSTWTAVNTIGDVKIRGEGTTILTGPGMDSGDYFIQPDTGSEIDIEGVRFTDWQGVLNFTASPSTACPKLRLIDNHVTSCNHFVRDGTNETAFTLVQIERNRITDVELAGIRIIGSTIARAYIRGNDITNLTGPVAAGVKGIWLGQNATAAEANRIIITDNQINGVAGQFGDTMGILAYGGRVHIQNNHVENVTDSIQTDVEGIYTKSAFSVVSGNTLIDAGGSEGCINVKGQERGGATTPLGYGCVIANNTIVDTQQDQFTTGISCRREDTLITGNVIEGTYYGIYVLNSTATQMSGVRILGNTIRNLRKNSNNVAPGTGPLLGIYVSEVNDVLVANNYIDDMGDAADSNPVHGIVIADDSTYTNTLRNVIRGNTVRNLKSTTGGDQRGIFVDVGAADAMEDVRIIGNECIGVNVAIRANNVANINNLVIALNDTTDSANDVLISGTLTASSAVYNNPDGATIADISGSTAGNVALQNLLAALTALLPMTDSTT